MNWVIIGYKTPSLDGPQDLIWNGSKLSEGMDVVSKIKTPYLFVRRHQLNTGIPVSITIQKENPAPKEILKEIKPKTK
jgi:hypothetical protein